jgi:hypothetical protein
VLRPPNLAGGFSSRFPMSFNHFSILHNHFSILHNHFSVPHSRRHFVAVHSIAAVHSSVPRHHSFVLRYHPTVMFDGVGVACGRRSLVGFRRRHCLILCRGSDYADAQHHNQSRQKYLCSSHIFFSIANYIFELFFNNPAGFILHSFRLLHTVIR